MDNPFDDIVPRITAAEKRAQQRAREEAQKEQEEAERRKGAKKCAYTHSIMAIQGIHTINNFLQECQALEFW